MGGVGKLFSLLSCVKTFGTEKSLGCGLLGLLVGFLAIILGSGFTSGCGGIGIGSGAGSGALGCGAKLTSIVVLDEGGLKSIFGTKIMNTNKCNTIETTNAIRVLRLKFKRTTLSPRGFSK